MKKLSVKLLVEITYITILVTCSIIFTRYTILHTEPQDFNVYYDSAKTALHGGLIYNIYGPAKLPYWYFPWVAWAYIPLAFFSQQTAYIIYTTVSLLSALASIYFLAKKMLTSTNLLNVLFIFSMSLLLCWLLFRVGQMDFILLAITTLTIYLIDAKRPFQAGLLIPIFLFKPHLFIIFFPYALLKGGKSFFFSALLTTLTLISISFIVIPDWPFQMLRLLGESGQRTDNIWNFTTLPTMLNAQENWSGTANLPFTFALILIGFFAIWSVRKLQTFPVLSMALAASLFSAPRAYSYNFPILIPALIWLSSGLPKTLFLLLWTAVGTLPFLFHFSTGMYSIVIFVFVIGIVKATIQLREIGKAKFSTIEEST